MSLGRNRSRFKVELSRMVTNKNKQDKTSKEWKLEALQNEIDSEKDFLDRCDSKKDEGYVFAKEVLEDLKRWQKDIRNDSSSPLSKEDLECRDNTIDNRIQMHKDILEVDDTLSDDDRRSIKKDLNLTKVWKKQLKKEKKAGC